MSEKHHPQRQLCAIMFTDIVGFTKTMEDNESSAMEFLNDQREIVKPIIDLHDGQF